MSETSRIMGTIKKPKEDNSKKSFNILIETDLYDATIICIEKFSYGSKADYIRQLIKKDLFAKGLIK